MVKFTPAMKQPQSSDFLEVELKKSSTGQKTLAVIKEAIDGKFVPFDSVHSALQYFGKKAKRGVCLGQAIAILISTKNQKESKKIVKQASLMHSICFQIQHMLFFTVKAYFSNLEIKKSLEKELLQITKLLNDSETVILHLQKKIKKIKKKRALSEYSKTKQILSCKKDIENELKKLKNINQKIETIKKSLESAHAKLSQMNYTNSHLPSEKPSDLEFEKFNNKIITLFNTNFTKKAHLKIKEHLQFDKNELQGSIKKIKELFKKSIKNQSEYAFILHMDFQTDLGHSVCGVISKKNFTYYDQNSGLVQLQTKKEISKKIHSLFKDVLDQYPIKALLIQVCKREKS